MTRQPSDTDWITEGATVYEYRAQNYDAARLADATIAKVTKTQIVLTNGHRFNRETLRLVGERRGDWTAPTVLKAPDDPAVLDAQAAERWDGVARQIAELDRLKGSGARLNAAAVAGLLDKASALIAEARSAVDAARVAEGNQRDA